MYDYYRETLRTKTKQKKKRRLNLIYLFVCLFVWWFIVPLEKVSLIWKRPYQ